MGILAVTKDDHRMCAYVRSRLLGPHEDGIKDNIEFEVLCVDVKQDGLKCCTYMHSTQAGTGMTPEHRARTVDSMIAAAAALRLQNDSLFTAVACLDRYLSVVPTQATLLQPAGIACLWLAAKFEEVYNQQLLRGINFSRFMLGPGGNLLGEAPAALQLLVLLEERILTALDYRLASIVTVITCKHRIMQQLCSGSGATAKQQAGLMMLSSPPAAGGLSKLQLDQLYCMTSYLTEISLLEYQLLTCRPGELAAAALAVAGLLLGLPGQDEQHLLSMTGFNMHELAVPMEWSIQRAHSTFGRHMHPEMAPGSRRKARFRFLLRWGIFVGKDRDIPEIKVEDDA
eukprot:gene8902-9079_t